MMETIPNQESLSLKEMMFLCWLHNLDFRPSLQKKRIVEKWS